MHCHLLIPALFPPPALTRENDPLHGMRAPALQTLLSRGSLSPCAADEAESWLCGQFGVLPQPDYPLGALGALAEGLEAENACWLRADPVHLSVERDQLILTDTSAFALTQEEAIALVTTLDQHFSPDGLRFFAPDPHHWYLRLDQDAVLTTHSLYQAAGKDIRSLLPAGRDATRWRALLNEVQMLLFDHPVNVARETRRSAAVNSIWLWGAGRSPEKPPHSSFTKIWGGDSLAHGLANAAAVPAAALPGNAQEWLSTPVPGDHLVVLDSLRPLGCYGDVSAWREELARLEQHWFAPLLQALQRGYIRLTLYAPGPATSLACTIRRADLWKLWKRKHPLSYFRHA